MTYATDCTAEAKLALAISIIETGDTEMIKAYEVQKTTYDAARPYAVVATFRSFNKIIERYSDESAAKRRARDMNRITKIKV